MWTKLVELVETKWENQHISEQGGAKAINSIYGAMHNCHVAFQKLDVERNEQNFANFAFAIDGLISTLRNLNSVFQLFDAESGGQLDDYLLSPDRIGKIDSPREFVLLQIRFLRELVRKESSLSGLPGEEISDFSGSKDQLGEFILRRFSMPEIFGKS